MQSKTAKIKVTRPASLSLAPEKEIKITQWQKNILDERIKNASADSSKNWDNVKDDFTFNS